MQGSASDNSMVKQLIFATRVPGLFGPVRRPCGTRMYYAMRDVKDMGQQMGNHTESSHAHIYLGRIFLWSQVVQLFLF